jgi:PAS domain S-box-containing protein
MTYPAPTSGEPAVRVLVVDDHEAVRRGIRTLLASDKDLSICGEAADGVEAIAKAKQLNPDVVLMDVTMPRMNGLQATQAIRRCLPATKIIIVSQNDPGIVRQQAAEVEAHGHVGKSDLSQQLIHAIEGVVGRRSGEVLQSVSSNVHGRGGESQVSTEWSAAQVELARQHRDRLDLVTQATDVGFWFCDLPFDKLIWDNRVKEHFWLPPDAEVTINTFYQQLHPDDRERTRQAIAHGNANDTPYDIEYRTLAPDGRVKWIRAMGRTFYDPAGRPRRFDGLTMDITARKQAEEATALLAPSWLRRTTPSSARIWTAASRAGTRARSACLDIPPPRRSASQFG